MFILILALLCASIPGNQSIESLADSTSLDVILMYLKNIERDVQDNKKSIESNKAESLKVVNEVQVDLEKQMKDDIHPLQLK